VRRSVASMGDVAVATPEQCAAATWALDRLETITKEMVDASQS